jgi:hypothetical protein
MARGCWGSIARIASVVGAGRLDVADLIGGLALHPVD